jgi:hypothetical protein
MTPLPANPPPTPTPVANVKKRALLIGINYERTSSQLHGCINDAHNMKNYLVKEWEYEGDEIRMLTDDAATDEFKPTKKNILSSIEWLIKDASAGDSLFLHYSGHGGSVYDHNSDEKDKRDETICPLDYQTNGTIKDDELRKVLIDPLNRGVSLFSVFDCCHSGTILDLKYKYKVNVTPEETDYDIFVRRKYKRADARVFMFSGCKDAQTSMDAFEEGQSQGAMTYAFLETIEYLKEKQQPLTYWLLLRGLLTVLKDKKYEQVPQLSSGTLCDLDQLVALA